MVKTGGKEAGDNQKNLLESTEGQVEILGPFLLCWFRLYLFALDYAGVNSPLNPPLFADSPPNPPFRPCSRYSAYVIDGFEYD